MESATATYEEATIYCDENDANMADNENAIQTGAKAEDETKTEDETKQDDSETETETETVTENGVFLTHGPVINITGAKDHNEVNERVYSAIKKLVRSYMGENVDRVAAAVKFSEPTTSNRVYNMVRKVSPRHANKTFVFNTEVPESIDGVSFNIIFTRQDPNSQPVGADQGTTKEETKEETKQETKIVTEADHTVFVKYRSPIDTITGTKNANEANVRVFNTVKGLARSHLNRVDISRVVVSVSFSEPTTSIAVCNVVKKVSPKYEGSNSFMFHTEVQELPDGTSFDIVFTRQNLESQQQETEQVARRIPKQETKRVSKRVTEQETVDLGLVTEPVQSQDGEFMKDFPASVSEFLSGKLTDADAFSFTIVTHNGANSESVKMLIKSTCTGFDCDSVETKPFSELLVFHTITIRRKSSVRREAPSQRKPNVYHKPSGQRSGEQEGKRSDAGEVPRRRFYEGYLGCIDFQPRDDVTDGAAQQKSLHWLAKKLATRKPVRQAVHAIRVKVGDLAGCTDDARKFVFSALRNALGNEYTASCEEEEEEGVFAMIYRRS